LEKLVEIGILFDFYGKLLSNKQYLVIDFYYIHDLSLVEIGVEIDVTRQGVFDILKRAEKKLYSYEEKLKLVEKFYSSNSYIEDIKNISKEILKKLEDENKKDNYILKKVTDISEICGKILENSREVI
jgi:uncharacterized protein